MSQVQDCKATKANREAAETSQREFWKLRTAATEAWKEEMKRKKRRILHPWNKHWMLNDQVRCWSVAASAYQNQRSRKLFFRISDSCCCHYTRRNKFIIIFFIFIVIVIVRRGRGRERREKNNASEHWIRAMTRASAPNLLPARRKKKRNLKKQRCGWMR